MLGAQGLLDQFEQLRTGDLGVLPARKHGVLGAVLDQEGLALAVVFEIAARVALLGVVERRLGDEEVSPLDDLGHVAEEEGEQKRADVAAVDVGVGHDDDLVISQLFEIELVGADPRAERGDQRADLGRREHLVEARALHVQDLAPEWQDGLEPPVAALLGRAASRIALDQEELRARGVPFLAVGQLAGQG